RNCVRQSVRKPPAQISRTWGDWPMKLALADRQYRSLQQSQLGFSLQLLVSPTLGGSLPRIVGDGWVYKNSRYRRPSRSRFDPISNERKKFITAVAQAMIGPLQQLEHLWFKRSIIKHPRTFIG